MVELLRRDLFAAPPDMGNLTVVPTPGFVKLHIRDSDPAKAFAEALGFAPPPMTRLAQQDGLIAITIAPGEWLMVTEAAADAARLIAQCETALHDRLFLAIDMSHALVRLHYDGPQARDAIAALCPLDLSDAVFDEGSAARSLFGDAAAIIMRVPGGTGLQLIVDQSAAPYAWRVLGGAVES